MRLRRDILARVPDAQITCQPGRASSFEVTCNEELMFSKYQSKGFPDFPELVEAVVNVSKGSAPTQVTSTDSSWCIIL